MKQYQGGAERGVRDGQPGQMRLEDVGPRSWQGWVSCVWRMELIREGLCVERSRDAGVMVKVAMNPMRGKGRRTAGVSRGCDCSAPVDCFRACTTSAIPLVAV